MEESQIPIPKIGDYLIFKDSEDKKNSFRGQHFTIGEAYRVNGVYKDLDGDLVIALMDDSGDDEPWTFTILPYGTDGTNYLSWFEPLPDDIKNFDFFNQLTEQENKVRNKIENLVPGMKIIVTEVYPDYDGCTDRTNEVLEELKGTICSIVTVEEDISICSHSEEWGVLLKSDNIKFGHNGFGNDSHSPVKCNHNDCYWLTEKVFDFEVMDYEFDTENVFNQLFENEDNDQWLENLSKEFNETLKISRNQHYIINLCKTIINVDDLRPKFNQLYGEDRINKLVLDFRVNIFNNQHIENRIKQTGEGIIIYVHPEGLNTISTGWDACGLLPKTNPYTPILSLSEFLRLKLV